MNCQYHNIKIRGITIGEHRYVWKCHNGEIPLGYEIHHINGIKDDNRIDNLTLVTRSEHARLHGYSPLRSKYQFKFGNKPKNYDVFRASLVPIIRELLKNGKRVCEIVRELSIPKTFIVDVKRDRSYINI